MFEEDKINETPLMGLRQFFPTGTYAGIGKKCVEFENVMKSATKKNTICLRFVQKYNFFERI